MIDMDCMAGDEINETIDKALDRAKSSNVAVCFFFNGVVVIVKPDSQKELVHRDWSRAMSGYMGDCPVVGPEYMAVLTAEELASDAAIEAQNEERRAKSLAEMQAKDEAKRKELHRLLEGAPQLELVDLAQWKKYVKSNQDSYGACCVRYAEKWGRLMQARIDRGEALADIADETSHQADDEGITGFMHHAAGNMLVNCWRFGSELRDHYESKRTKQVRSEASLVLSVRTEYRHGEKQNVFGYSEQ